MTDTSARIHIAASDPAFPAKREAAVAMICAAITAIATPLGYVQSGTNWARSTVAGRSVINLQRNRYGWDCTLNLRFLTPDGTSPQHGFWADSDDIGLDRFHLPTDGPATGNLVYLDIHADPSTLDQSMQILRDRALPWLDAHHSGSPKITHSLNGSDDSPTV